MSYMQYLNEKSSTDIPSADWLTRLITCFMLLQKRFRSPFSLRGLRGWAARFNKQNFKLPEGIDFERVEFAGLTCDRLYNAKADKVVLHFYGGGYCIRMPDSEIPAIAAFCRSINAEAFLPWYRLAPEDPFPAAPEDCLKVYEALLEQGTDPQRIILSGISAGGGNALSLLAMIKARQLPMPAYVTLASPSGDGLLTTESWHQNASSCAFFKLEDILIFSGMCVQPDQRSDPLLNVTLMDDFSGYPPMHLSASTKEVLRDVSIITHEKALAAGVTSTLTLFKGGFHCLPVLWPKGRQSKAIWQQIIRDLPAHLK